MQQHETTNPILAADREASLPAMPKVQYSRVLCAVEITEAHFANALKTADKRLVELARQLLVDFNQLLSSPEMQTFFVHFSSKFRLENFPRGVTCPLTDDLLPTLGQSGEKPEQQNMQSALRVAGSFWKEGTSIFIDRVRSRVQGILSKLDGRLLTELDEDSRGAIVRVADFFCKRVLSSELKAGLDQVRSSKAFDLLSHALISLRSNLKRQLPNEAFELQEQIVGAVAARALLQLYALRLFDDLPRAIENLTGKLAQGGQSFAVKAKETLDTIISNPANKLQVPALSSLISNFVDSPQNSTVSDRSVTEMVHEEWTRIVRAWFLMRSNLSEILALDVILQSGSEVADAHIAMRDAVRNILLSNKVADELRGIRKLVPKALDGDVLHVNLWDLKAPRVLEACHLACVNNVVVHGDMPPQFPLPEGEEYLCLRRWYHAVKSRETRVKVVQLNQAFGSGAALVEMELRGFAAKYLSSSVSTEGSLVGGAISWLRQGPASFYSFSPGKITYIQSKIPDEIAKLENRCGTPMIWSTDKDGNLRYVIIMDGRRDPDSAQFKLQRPTNWVTIVEPVGTAIKLTAVESVTPVVERKVVVETPALPPVPEAKAVTSVEVSPQASQKNGPIEVAPEIEKVAQKAEANKEAVAQLHQHASHVLEKELSELLGIWLSEAKALGVFGSALKEELPVLERAAQGRPLKAKEFRMLARFPDRLKGKHKVTYSNLAISAKIEELGEILGDLSSNSSS